MQHHRSYEEVDMLHFLCIMVTGNIYIYSDKLSIEIYGKAFNYLLVGSLFWYKILKIAMHIIKE